MNWMQLTEQISAALEQELTLSDVSFLPGGDINKAVRLHTNQQDIFVKFNDARYLPMMEAEAYSLEQINKCATMQCPLPTASGMTGSKAWLALEYLELEDHGDDFERGKQLARMHSCIHQSHQPFGWAHDNFIGSTPQRNQWHRNWTDFYREERILPQIALAYDKGAPFTLKQKAEKLVDKLDNFFIDYHPEASLLHGDLWGGNSRFLEDSTPVVFDPASYYGDRETDLAMTILFGGFSQYFYDGYHSVFPIDKGFEQRIPLYNLYHILNHFNLFGGGYAMQAEEMIDKLLKN